MESPDPIGNFEYAGHWISGIIPAVWTILKECFTPYALSFALYKIWLVDAIKIFLPCHPKPWRRMAGERVRLSVEG
jgi:hypothetical protein